MIPRFAELPGGRSWGVFGDGDLLGTLNLVGAAEVVAAAALVRQGKVFALSTRVDVPGPALFHRHEPRHELVSFETPDGGTTFDDSLDSFWLQGSSQWDALRHFGDDGGVFYGGRGPGESAVLGIDRIAERGLAARGVVVDLAPAVADPFEPVALGVRELEAALRSELIQLGRGDVLLVRTGWLERYLELEAAARAELASGVPGSAGLRDPDLPAFLWDSGVAAVAADNPALEPIEPGVGLDHALHKALIARLGMPLGELWQLGPLAADCRADGVHECLLVAAPLNVRGGAGSPANALALK